MSFGKRQLILAALVVSLGAAVYLNWQFSDNGEITAVDVNASEQELGAAQLVNGSHVLSEAPSEAASETETASAAEQTVSANADVESTPERSEAPAEETIGDAAVDYFAEAALNRQKTRDEAVEMLNEVLDNTDASKEDTRKAVEQSAAIAKNMLSESNIESLVKAKGYSDCVVFIQDAECNVVVGKDSEFTAEDAITVRDIVIDQSGLAADQIKIVDHVTA